jgi:hypothetical protein
MQTLQANESSSLELVLIISFSAGKQRDALHHSQIFDSLEIFFQRIKKIIFFLFFEKKSFSGEFPIKGFLFEKRLVSHRTDSHS